jgi:hypothetical protein
MNMKYKMSEARQYRAKNLLFWLTGARTLAGWILTDKIGRE